MNKNLVYFISVRKGYLYSLSLKKSEKYLKNHPNWINYDADSEYIEYIESVFESKGKILGHQGFNVLTTY